MFNSTKLNISEDEHMSSCTAGHIGFISHIDYPYRTGNNIFIHSNCSVAIKNSFIMNENKVLAQLVWAKGEKVSGRNERDWRFDKYGALICFAEYGKQSEYGWEIDHVIPKSRGGSSDISNLQPLQWNNNRRKSDGLIPIIAAYQRV